MCIIAEITHKFLAHTIQSHGAAQTSDKLLFEQWFPQGSIRADEPEPGKENTSL